MPKVGMVQNKNISQQVHHNRRRTLVFHWQTHPISPPNILKVFFWFIDCIYLRGFGQKSMVFQKKIRLFRANFKMTVLEAQKELSIQILLGKRSQSIFLNILAGFHEIHVRKDLNWSKTSNRPFSKLRRS